MGLEAVYQKPRLSQRNPDHKVSAYLLRDVTVERADQVWCTDITYIPIRRGWVYILLVAILDWFIRYVLAWEVSVTLDSSFCISALQRALVMGTPEIFNSYQSSQFTSRAFSGILESAGVANQHGRSWASVEALANGQVRGGVPARLPDGGGGRVRHSPVHRVLQ